MHWEASGAAAGVRRDSRLGEKLTCGADDHLEGASGNVLITQLDGNLVKTLVGGGVLDAVSAILVIDDVHGHVVLGGLDLD